MGRRRTPTAAGSQAAAPLAQPRPFVEQPRKQGVREAERERHRGPGPSALPASCCGNRCCCCAARPSIAIPSQPRTRVRGAASGKSARCDPAARRRQRTEWTSRESSLKTPGRPDVRSGKSESSSRLARNGTGARRGFLAAPSQAGGRVWERVKDARTLRRLGKPDVRSTFPTLLCWKAAVRPF